MARSIRVRLRVQRSQHDRQAAYNHSLFKGDFGLNSPRSRGAITRPLSTTLHRAISAASTINLRKFFHNDYLPTSAIHIVGTSDSTDAETAIGERSVHGYPKNSYEDQLLCLSSIIWQLAILEKCLILCAFLERDTIWTAPWQEYLTPLSAALYLFDKTHSLPVSIHKRGTSAPRSLAHYRAWGMQFVVVDDRFTDETRILAREPESPSCRPSVPLLCKDKRACADPF